MAGRATPAGEADAVFVPLSPARWRRLVADRELPGPLPAYGATEALRRWGEFSADETEDGLCAAQGIAGVATLTAPDAEPEDRRIVVAVPAAAFRPADDSVLGAGEVPGLRWSEVTAVFSDDESVSPAAVRAVARGMDPAEAWDHPAVAAFAEQHDLGWFTPQEAARW